MKKSFILPLILCLMLCSVPAIAANDVVETEESGIADVIGNLQLIPDEVQNMTDDELADYISSKSERYGVDLTESQVEQLTSLCRGLEKMNSEEIKEKIESIMDTVGDINEKKNNIAGFFSKAAAFFSKIADFFKKIAGAIYNLF